MTRTRLMNTTACALVLSVGGLSFSSEAWSFTQPNSVSPAYIAGLNSQAAAGRAASAVTVAPKVAVVASGPSAAAKAASLVTIAAPAVTTAITSQALAGKAASLVTIGAPAITTAITSQALAGKAASQVTFASPATKIAQNIAAATPKDLLTPGKATPDYGPYDDSGTSTPNPYASLTDLQPANDQTFSNPSFAQGLTNLNFNQLAAANADPKNAITVDPTNPPKSMTPAPNSSASSKLGAAGAAAGGAITNANGQTGAGSSLNSGVSAAAAQILWQSELQGATANAGASDAPGGIVLPKGGITATTVNLPGLPSSTQILPGIVAPNSIIIAPPPSSANSNPANPFSSFVNGYNAQVASAQNQLNSINTSATGGPLTKFILGAMIPPSLPGGSTGGGFSQNPNSGGSAGQGGGGGTGAGGAGDVVSVEGETAATGFKVLAQDEGAASVINSIVNIFKVIPK